MGPVASQIDLIEGSGGGRRDRVFGEWLLWSGNYRSLYENVLYPSRSCIHCICVVQLTAHDPFSSPGR